jgi:hypothetical protein
VISVIEDVTVVTMLFLAFQYWYIALPVLLLMLAGIVMFLPLLFRIAGFLMAGFLGALRSLLASAPPSGMAPHWAPNGVQTVRVFTRRVKGAPRMAPGWLNPQTGEFHFRRWGSVRTLAAGSVDETAQWGLLFDVIRTGSGATFYITKEWTSALKPAAAPA